MKIFRFIYVLFTQHPSSVGESYFQHLITAVSFGFKMSLASIACFLHGFFPFLFVKTTSTMVDELYNTMILHRNKKEGVDGV